MAKAKGCYANENIEVNSKKHALEGENDFAITHFHEHQDYLQQGKPLVALMAAFQIPPPGQLTR